MELGVQSWALASNVYLRCRVALFPGSTPLSVALPYGKIRRAWYLSSHEHDIIENKQAVFRVLFNQLYTVYDNHPPLASCYVCSFCCSGLCVPMHN